MFTGGGTAGHVYPALAVIGALGAGFEISWIGSRTGMERGLVSEAGIRYHAIPAGKWRRYLSAENIADMLRVIGGVVAALTVLLRERPALVFSKGGYVTVPPVLAARMLRIPVITHESDTDPGLATRINSRFADLVLTSFAETVEWFPPALRPRVVTTGNPVRERFFRGDAAAGRAAAGAPEGMPIVLVLGGSLGSETVNRLVRGALPRLAGRCVDRPPDGRAGLRVRSISSPTTGPSLLSATSCRTSWPRPISWSPGPERTPLPSLPPAARRHCCCRSSFREAAATRSATPRTSPQRGLPGYSKAESLGISPTR